MDKVITIDNSLNLCQDKIDSIRREVGFNGQNISYVKVYFPLNFQSLCC